MRGVWDLRIWPMDDGGVLDCSGIVGAARRMKMAQFGCSLVSKSGFREVVDTRFGVGGRGSLRRGTHCWLCRHLGLLVRLNRGFLLSCPLTP